MVTKMNSAQPFVCREVLSFQSKGNNIVLAKLDNTLESDFLVISDKLEAFVCVCMALF